LRALRQQPPSAATAAAETEAHQCQTCSKHPVAL
jgi:hypothetical protein